MARRKSRAQAQAQAEKQAAEVIREVKDSSPNTNQTGRNQRQPTHLHALRHIFVAVSVLILAGLSSTVSQLTLSPVYGSVLSAIYHQRGSMVAAICGWLAKNWLHELFSSKVRYFLPILAFAIPTIQFLLFKLSSTLGPIWGPVVTELSTFYPLAALSTSAAAYLLEDIAFSTYSGVVNQGAFLGSYVLFSIIQKWSRATIPLYIGSNGLLTRGGLELAIAALYAISLPSKFLALVAPVFVALNAVGIGIRTPMPLGLELPNLAPQPENFVVVHSQESVTGYLSVLENTRDHFRALRCDHSLLGGEWTKVPGGSKSPLGEPIYSVFTMLEAVRLIQNDNDASRKPDAESSALVIGLGIGTTPAALITHGIDTTVVEIDPGVYDLAIKYFSLPHKFTPELRDAVEYVEEAKKNGSHFDYIVHDVFTGGVEPVDLFTAEFMRGLYDILADDGAVAINYAGDLLSPSAGLVVRTILSIFPSCRIFRESDETSGIGEGDFTNTVIFCKKTAAPLKFRKPVKADFLGSGARETYLFPRFEIESAFFKNDAEGGGEILQAGKVGQIQQWQTKSAAAHWHIMRFVLPNAVWERW